MSELDQINPDTLTRSQAASLFQTKVAEHQRNTGDDLIKAWAVVRTLNPKLASAMGVHDEAPAVANVQPIGRYSDSSGILKGPVSPDPYTARGVGMAPNLAGKLMPSRTVSIPNSEEQAASRWAHLASSIAEGNQSHLAAAAAHETAAAAQDKAGDTDAAEMHRRMASFHTSQANRSKKT